MITYAIPWNPKATGTLTVPAKEADDGPRLDGTGVINTAYRVLKPVGKDADRCKSPIFYEHTLTLFTKPPGIYKGAYYSCFWRAACGSPDLF